MANSASHTYTRRSTARRHAVRARRVLGFLALALASLPLPIFAQQYHADPVDEKARSFSASALICVKNADRYVADKDRFLEYFGNYYFPAMTRFGAADLAELGEKRYSLFNRILWPATSPQLQIDLTELAFEKMIAVVRSGNRNYHPAVRYNAVLVLGLLDEQYPSGGPRKPYKPAHDLLKQIVDAAVAGKNVDPALLVGALVGLERHAQNRDAFDRATLDAFRASLLKLIALEPLAPQANRQVSEWIRLQTASTLAKLGSPGEKGEVQAALLKLIAGENEPKLSLNARGQIAALLGLMNYQGATVDGKATADAMLKLVDAVVAEEAKEAQAFEDVNLSNFGQGPPPKGRFKQTQFGSAPEYERRTLLARFADVRRGLEATKPIVPAEQQATYDAILAAARPVADAAANKDEIDLELARKIRVMSDTVQRTLNPGEAPAAVEDTGDLF